MCNQQVDQWFSTDYLITYSASNFLILILILITCLILKKIPQKKHLPGGY
jgi:hypothetical protein